jgi:serine/threonine-protein kinase
MTARVQSWVCPACGCELRRGCLCPQDGLSAVTAEALGGGRLLPVRVGAVVDGRYRVVAEAGRGGHAHVYRAVHVLLQQAVALKVLRPDVADRDDFLGEARTAAALRHPNVVTVFDAGEWDGAPYLVMPWIGGGSADAWVRSSTPGLRTRLGVLTDVLSALDAAHSAGIIHCDVKPTNVLLEPLPAEETRGARPGVRGLLSDFGVARLGRAVASRGGGTPLYMAPEQLGGDPVGPDTDVYAAGCLAWALVTGSPPHRAARLQELVRRRLSEAPLALPAVARFEVPGGLADVIGRALARDRAARWPTAAAFREALAPWLAMVSDEPARRAVEPRPVDAALEQTERAPRRRAVLGRDRTPQAEAPSGREPIAARLTAIARDAIHGGRGAVVLLTAEPGLGRTRLVRWLSLRLAADPAVHVVSLRCLRDTAPWQMVRGALTLLTAGLDGVNGPAALGRRLTRMRLEPPVDPAAAWRLLTGRPAEDDAPQLSADDCARWLLGEAESHPVALLLDDAELCDPASAAVIRQLAAALVAQPRPLLLLVALRTGADGEARGVGADLLRLGGDGTERIALTHLDRRGLDALVDGECPGASPDVRMRLWELTAGHPLFARSLLRGWTGAGAGVGGGDGEPGLPPALEQSARAPLSPALAQSLLSWVDDLLLAHEAREGRDAREVLSQLAVLGREPQPAAHILRYLDILGWAPEQRDQALDDLTTAGLLVEVGRGTEERLAFAHELVREALETVLRSRPRRRRAWHRAAAAALRDRAPFDDPEPLARRAEHLSAAGDPDQAATSWIRAARVAELNGAAERATGLLVRGLAALAEAAGSQREARGRLHVARAALAARRGDLATVRQHAGAGLSDLLGFPRSPGLHRAASLLARGAALARDRPVALTTICDAAARLEEGQQPAAAAALLFEAAALRAAAGEPDETAALLLRAAALAGLVLPDGEPDPARLLVQLVPVFGAGGAGP